jgi:hypothetical protein
MSGTRFPCGLLIMENFLRMFSGLPYIDLNQARNRHSFVETTLLKFLPYLHDHLRKSVLHTKARMSYTRFIPSDILLDILVSICHFPGDPTPVLPQEVNVLFEGLFESVLHCPLTVFSDKIRT